MSDDDADEYVYYGTPLYQEHVSLRYATKSAPVDAAKEVALPVHQQEVRDAQGRQRLHGAFTGGYSAGHFNTVGSQEGFNPAAFSSSRGNRAGHKQQSVSDFLDEDELAELREKGLHAKAEYDTFATSQGATSQAQAAQQAAARHGGAGLNLFPEEALKPVVNSIGVQLLQKMGWRQGRGLGFQEANSLEQMGLDLSAISTQQEGAQPRAKRRRWGPLAGLQLHNTRVIHLPPKNNVFGLGYDPYENAEEFRVARKRLREEVASGQQPAVDARGVRKRGTAFAPSVLEDTDVYGGELADYADDTDPRAGLHFEVVSSEEDDEPVTKARRMSPGRIGGSAPTQLLKARQGTMGRDSFIEGFLRGTMQPAPSVACTPIPSGVRRTFHRFAQPCSHWYGALRKEAVQHATPATEAAPAEPELPPPPPQSAEVKKRVDLAAAAVARGGEEMLQFLKRTREGDEDYAFLDGGEHGAYFQRRLQDIRAAVMRATNAVLRATAPHLQQQPTTPPTAGRDGRLDTSEGKGGGAQARVQLSVEQRRQMLAEPQLPGTSGPAAHHRQARPEDAAWRQGAAAGGGGRGVIGGGTKEEVWALAESAGLVRKGAALSSRFVKAGEGPAEGTVEATVGAAGKEALSGSPGDLPPVRTQIEWQPSSLLCKRWNVAQPTLTKASEGGSGATGADLLTMPEEKRAGAYAAALPDFMRPPESSARLGGPDGRGEELPPPPPRPGQPSGAHPATDEAAALDQAADEMLADIEADLAAEVETAAPDPEELPSDKPLDVFKAIFEGSDSEEDDEGEEGSGGEGEGDGKVPGLPAGSSQQPGTLNAAPPRTDAAARLQQAQQGAIAAARTAEEAGTGRGSTWAGAAHARPQADGSGSGDSEDGLVLQRGASGGRGRSRSTSPEAGRGGGRRRSPAVGTRHGSRGGSPDDQRRRREDREEDGEGDGRSGSKYTRSRSGKRERDWERDREKSSKHKKSKKKKKDDKHGKRERREERVLEDAAEVLRSEVRAQNVSTDEIIAMARELKRRKKDKEKHSSSKHEHRQKRDRSRSP